jgi:hypothetical protein
MNFSDGNSIANYVPLESFLAMVDEGWRYRAGGKVDGQSGEWF